MIKLLNKNNKTIEGIITFLLPFILLIDKDMYNYIIYFYIFLTVDYFTNFIFTIFLSEIKYTEELRKLFNMIIRLINLSKYILIIYLLLISIK